MRSYVRAARACWEGRPYGVLIVHDEPGVRDTLSFSLRKKGFRVFQASVERSPLNTYWYYRERIDAVLLDSPGILLKLRTLTTRVHCCFINGNPVEYKEQTLRELGAVEVFNMPFSAEDVAARVLHIVTNPILNPSFKESRRRIIRRRPQHEGVVQLQGVCHTAVLRPLCNPYFQSQ